jgi:hypothetical protein
MSHTSIALGGSPSISRTSGKRPSSIFKWDIWLRGILAAGICGGANGVITGLAAIQIHPEHFNLGGGLHLTLVLAGVSAMVSGITGVAAYLKKSPLPKEQ